MCTDIAKLMHTQHMHAIGHAYIQQIQHNSLNTPSTYMNLKEFGIHVHVDHVHVC